MVVQWREGCSVRGVDSIVVALCAGRCTSRC